jgi:hypothetical protein
MIYQLIRRDPVWNYLPYLILLSAVAGLFLAASPGHVALVGGYVGFGGVFLCRPHQRATRFQAALPVAGRQLFLARVSLMMAMLWLPAIACGAAVLISGGFANSALAPMEIATVCTLSIMAVQSVRVRELNGPMWLLYALFLIPGMGLQLVASPHAAIPVVATCAALAVALFLRNWRAVPKSFQIAPVGVSADAAPVGHAKAKSGGEPATVWLPILRSVFSWQYGMWLWFLFLAPKSVTWIGSCGFSLAALWGIARQRTGWVQALPIRPRVVLWTILAPVLLTLALGYFVGFHFGSHSRPVPEVRDQVLNLAAMLGWALLVVLFLALFNWRRLRHVPLVIRRGLLGLLLGVPIVGSLTVLMLLSKPATMAAAALIPDALLRLSRVLPGNLPAVIAFAALPLAALCWAVDRVFEEAEYADKPRAPKDDPFLRA